MTHEVSREEGILSLFFSFVLKVFPWGSPCSQVVPHCTSDFISYCLAKVQFSCTSIGTVGPRLFSLQWTHPSSSSSSFLSTWLGYLHPFVSSYLSNRPDYSELPLCPVGWLVTKRIPYQYVGSFGTCLISILHETFSHGKSLVKPLL
jgi:hypothetical protein